MHAPLLRNGQPCKVVSHEIWFGGLSLHRRNLCSKCETCPKGTGGKREAHTIGTETYRTPKGQDETRFTTIRKQQATKDRRQEPNHNKKRDVNASTPQPNFSPTDALLSISLPPVFEIPNVFSPKDLPRSRARVGPFFCSRHVPATSYCTVNTTRRAASEYR